MEGYGRMARISENHKCIIKMGTGEKLKVVMICHFSNSEVREHLPLSNRKHYRFVRRLLCLPGKNKGYADIAPWDSNIIKCVKEREDIDLFVISAHGGLKRSIVSFDLDGIHYSFIRPEFTNFLKVIIPSHRLWRRINPMTPRIISRVNKIHPDIVVLVGAENAYYSSSVLSIKKYPVFVLCQNVISNPEYSSSSLQFKMNASTELDIIRTARYMAVYSKKHYDLLRRLAYKNSIFSFNWPVPSKEDFIPVPCSDKQYDFVNFAMHMSEGKGFHDSIKALAIVKEKYPDVRLCLVDGGNDEVRRELNHLISKLHLERNVTFIPFFKERNDLFQFLQSVRFSVLPCKVDHISGTQLQSMKYGLPLVCYKTTGTPLLNSEKRCVLIAEMNNVEQLAEKMLLLMDNPDLADELRLNSLEHTRKRRERSLENMSRLVDSFNSIISNFNNGIPIPENQLFEYRLNSESR